MSFFSGLISSVVGGLFSRNSAKQQASAAADLNAENRAWQHDEAEIARKWEEEQDAKAMQFNSFQSELSFQRELAASNSAHQREVQDLRAAGLNPILSANSNGATGVNAPMASASSVNAPMASANGISNMAQQPNFGPVVELFSSALDYKTKQRELDIKQQEADNDSVRVGNESKQLEATLESMKFTNENTKTNTERLKAEAIKIIQDTQNGKALTDAQIKQCEAISYQAVKVGNAQERLSIAQSNLADNQSKESHIRYENAKREYEDCLHELDKELHSKPGYQKLYQLGSYIKALNPFQGFKIGNGMLRGDK